MRVAVSVSAILCVATSLVGCAARQGATLHPCPTMGGPPTKQVMIHLKPAQGSDPQTIVITPDVPVFQPASDTDALKFFFQGPGPNARWDKARVMTFKIAGTNTDYGNPSPECSEVPAPGSSNPCLVTFQPPNTNDMVLVTYKILLRDSTGTEPDLLIDPVGIIKG